METIEQEIVPTLISLPSKELVACWDLTRLGGDLGSAPFFCPIVFSMTMAYHANPDLQIVHVSKRLAVLWFLCCGAKALIMTAGDIIDANIDAKVARTKGRAIPRGDISKSRASVFLALQAFVGWYLAKKCLKPDTVRIVALTWPLFVLRPTCKRWMSFAPIVSGLALNLGVYIGWSDLSTNGTLPWRILNPIYVGCCFWVIAYEPIYEHLDRAEYLKLGVKSFAIYCSEYTNYVCGACSVVSTSLLAYGAHLNNHGPLVYLGIAVATLLQLSGIAVTDINDKKQCKDFFLLTPRVGLALVSGFVADVLVHRWMNGIPL